VETHASASDPFRSLGRTLTGFAACVCQEWLKVWSETVCMESGQEKVVVSGMVVVSGSSAAAPTHFKGWVRGHRPLATGVHL
jgi:hypothetical protein